MISLFDTNILIALMDPNHVFHDLAHATFAEAAPQGWATCPITIHGCVRIMSQPAYPSFRATPQEVIMNLDVMTKTPGHHFWPASLSFLGESIFDRAKLVSHRSLTDLYLLALAVHHRGRLLTFDRSIPTAAVRGALPRHLTVLGAKCGGR